MEYSFKIDEMASEIAIIFLKFLYLNLENNLFSKLSTLRDITPGVFAQLTARPPSTSAPRRLWQ